MLDEFKYAHLLYRCNDNCDALKKKVIVMDLKYIILCVFEIYYSNLSLNRIYLQIKSFHASKCKYRTSF